MKKPFRTTFQESLIKELKKLAIDLGCDVNEILEVAYLHLVRNWNKEEISKMIEINK